MLRWMFLCSIFSVLFGAPSVLWVWAFSLNWGIAVYIAIFAGLIVGTLSNYQRVLTGVGIKNRDFDAMLAASEQSLSLSRLTVWVLLVGSISGAVVGLIRFLLG